MTLRLISVFLVCSVFVSCVTLQDQRSAPGVYKVTSKTCEGNSFEKAACNEIKLIEIVNGNFYKIKDDEFAFVIWSGERELTYSARKLDNFNGLETLPFKIKLDSSDTFIDNLIFEADGSGKYEFGKPNSLSTINFIKAQPEDIAKYQKEYPGSE